MATHRLRQGAGRGLPRLGGADRLRAGEGQGPARRFRRDL